MRPSLSYAVPIMASRDELKSLIDQVPETRLEMVHRMLNLHINPPPPHPEMDRMQRRSQDYQNLVKKQFHETRKPGTIGTMTSGGIFAEHEGTPYGRHAFDYWDDKALVHQILQFFDGHEIEIMQRLSFSPNRAALVCDLEISSAGHTVRHQDAFPT